MQSECAVNGNLDGTYDYLENSVPAFMKLASLKTQEYGYASFYAWNITYDKQVELHLRWPNKTRWTYAQCPES